MKNTLIAILVLIILVLGYFFIKEKTKPTDYSNAWPETVPATPTTNNNPITSTNNNQTNSNPTENNVSSAYYESGDDVNGIHTGYINSVSSSNGNYSVKINYVIMGNCPPVNPGDECVIDNNSLIRTFPISSSARITVFDDSMQPISASLQQFANIFSTEWGYSLNRIKLEGGLITEISPVYVP